MQSAAFLTAEDTYSMVYLAAERQVSFMVCYSPIFLRLNCQILSVGHHLAIAGELSLDIYVVSLSAKG